MTGDDRERHCASCNKSVRDLSAGTEEEARAFLREKRGERVCVRFARDGSGAVRFGAAAAAMAAVVSLAGCTTTKQPAKPPAAEVDHDMGDMIPDIQDKCPDDPVGASDDGCPRVAPDAGPHG
jgi:hypothetical protein